MRRLRGANGRGDDLWDAALLSTVKALPSDAAGALPLPLVLVWCWARPPFLHQRGKVMVLWFRVTPRPLQPASLRQKGRRRLVPQCDRAGFARSCLKRATQAAPVNRGVRAPVATMLLVALAFGAPSLP